MEFVPLQYQSRPRSGAPLSTQYPGGSGKGRLATLEM